MKYEKQETDAEYDKRQHALYWARENKRNAAEEMHWILKRIVEELPIRRDWLDPTLERAARAVLAKAEGK